ncbi:MAG: hypothetical protein FWH53_00860 [Leptospirales bacterium]|nr:hypothetical protein [Leptospirales bacterium]
MSALYKRYAEFNIDNKVLTSPPFTLEFETEYSVSTSNQTKAVIYNPSDETIAACEKKKDTNALITIDAGYEDDYGTCVVGEIVKFEIDKKIDKILTLTIADKTSLWTSAIINRSWKGSISAEDVIKNILNDVGITPAKIELEVNKIYSRGISFSGVPLRTTMKRLENDTKSDFFFKNGLAYFLKKQSASSTSVFYLSPTSGLLSAKKTDKGYTVKTLFLYKIGAGSLVEIDGVEVQGLFKVVSGKNKFSSKGQAGSEFEVKKL